MTVKYIFNPTTGNLDATDKVAFNGEVNAGTEAAPSIFFTGDTNTGIYSPGADQLALATNGTGRLFVDAGGNVGVGATTAYLTAANRGNISINGTDSILAFGNSGVLSTYIYSSTSVTEISTESRPLLFKLAGSERLRITSTGQLSHIGAGSSGSPAVAFNGSAPSNSLVIDSSGRVGLGTSSPGYALDVNGTVNTNASFQSTGTVFGRDNRENGFIVTSANTVALNRTLTIGNATYSNIVIPNGSVGVGTTSPTEAFTVGTGNAQITGGQLTVGVTATSGLQFINDGTFGTLNNIPLVLRTVSTERVRIDTSGRLLVGTASDSGGALLQVNGDRIRVGTAKTPASATDTGTAGEICWDANYIYVCTATNTWKRTAIATW